MKKFFVVFLALLFCSSLGLAYADDTDARIIIRMSGINRYETAVKASQIGWVDGSNYAIIVNGTNWADAISGIALATALDAPILLTGSGELGPLVTAELVRLGVKNIIILGGPKTVSTAIENQLKKNYVTKRIFGDTRYETTIAIANRVHALTDFDSVVIVTGKKFPDGLSAGTYAATGNMGILLCDGISLTDQLKTSLKDWNVKKVTIIGGTKAVSLGVTAQLESMNIAVTRLDGANRYDTSIITQKATHVASDAVVVVSGENYADALAGSSLAVKLSAPLILVKKYEMPSDVGTYIKSLSADKGYILGGSFAISEGVGSDVYGQLASYGRMYSVVNASKTNYIYDEMMEDLSQLSQEYPELATLSIIGKSVYGRDIPAMILGNPNAQKKILIHGGIHGREYMTTTLVMKQIETYLHRMVTGELYGGRPYYDILDEVALYFVPMVNPDGVMLSQQGLSSIAPDDSVLRQRLIDYNEGSTDFLRWKANLNGVDLNLNFDAGWKKDHYFSSPNYYRYAGGSPFDQPESQMLRDITLKYNFDLSVSYHTSGQIIFWYYDQGADAVNRDSAITDQLSAITSYRPVKSSTSNAMWGGYKDWYIQELNNPGFTLEVGPSSASSPLDVRYFDKIWQDNQYVPIYLAYRESR